MKKVSKEQAKKSVDAVAPQLPENVVVLVSLRKIKNDASGNPQVQLEIAQSRSLGGRKVSLLAALNAGDKRFNSGRTTMRVWPMVNKKGFDEVFGAIEGFDFDTAYKLALEAKDDEVVAIMKQVETVSVGGINHPAKIVCLETTNVESLPKSMREQMLDENVSDDIKERNILQTGVENSERILDSLGNVIYRRYDLQYGDVQDQMIEGKILASELAKKAAGTDVKSEIAKKLAGALNED